MKNFYCLLFLLIPSLLYACQKQEVETNEETENTIYITTQDDFDKWSNTSFPAGSTILFAAGESFSGQFILRGSGTADAPNQVFAYNPESGEVYSDWMENKPVINGEGEVTAALLLKNGSFWEINNLEVTNTDGSSDDQGDLLGINVIAEDVGTVENVTIKNCYVHNVNGEVGGKETGGIHVYVLGGTTKTKFDGLLIEGNHVANVGGVGIANQSTWKSINSDDYYPWTDVAIRKNRVEYTGRNGIIVRNSIDPMVEYNVLAYNSRFDTGHSVFNFNTIGCIVQYNEAYGNTSDNPDDIDHGGFDADYNSRGTIIQYNYSHDNNWFCGIMKRAVNTDITIRYNISQNELLGAFLYGFPKETGVKDVKIYNNTIYFGEGKGTQVFVSAGKTRIPIETSFYNNIFYFEEPAEWGFEPDSSCIFSNNLYYNLSSKGENALTEDPLFENPGTGGTNIDMTDSESLSGYCLKSNSPAINSGIVMEGYPGQDFFGNPVAGNPDLGAFEKQE